MKKEIILAVGSSSWWKNIKIRRESAFKLKVIKKKWKLRRKVLLMSKKIQLILKFIKNTIYTNDKYFYFSFCIFLSKYFVF